MGDKNKKIVNILSYCVSIFDPFLICFFFSFFIFQEILIIENTIFYSFFSGLLFSVSEFYYCKRIRKQKSPCLLQNYRVLTEIDNVEKAEYAILLSTVPLMFVAFTFLFHVLRDFDKYILDSAIAGIFIFLVLIWLLVGYILQSKSSIALGLVSAFFLFQGYLSLVNLHLDIIYILPAIILSFRGFIAARKYK
jgi:hypothetical protein